MHGYLWFFTLATKKTTMKNARNRILSVILCSIVVVGIALYLYFPRSLPQHALVTIRDIEFVLDVADTPREWQEGLSGRTTLAENGGMAFVFDEPGIYRFWTKDILVSLDLVWIENNRIIDLDSRIPVPAPGTKDADLPVYTAQSKSSLVLEIPAGTIEKQGILVGDLVQVEFR